MSGLHEHQILDIQTEQLQDHEWKFPKFDKRCTELDR